MSDRPMKGKHRSPGVYVHEKPGIPNSIAQVEAAIPAFIGYTEKGPNDSVKISSMSEFNTHFGTAKQEIGAIKIDDSGNITFPDIPQTPDFRLYYSVKMFFANGGENCCIISAGKFGESVNNEDLLNGLHRLRPDSDASIIVFPDLFSPLNHGEPFDVYTEALEHCSKHQRFLICDVQMVKNGNDVIEDSATEFRNKTGTNQLKFGAAYFPDLKTTLNHHISEEDITVQRNGNILVLRHTDETIHADPGKEKESVYHIDDSPRKQLYQTIKNKISCVRLILPPSGAIAGVYARIDKAIGVWKAPANVSVHRASSTTADIDNQIQSMLNVHSSGKSINAIRYFDGKGVMVWGARTLAGNDNEWRYIPVRRFFNMVEKSLINSTKWVLSEPNNAQTWTQVKRQIENYLNGLWRKGALAGRTSDRAYFVKAGLGETMTGSDISDGKIIVEIGLAALRPAEFIVLRISHQADS